MPKQKLWMMGCKVDGSHHAEYVCTSIFFDMPGVARMPEQ
jgi:hypothetical protein